MRIEPKTFFANERTFLTWLHMAVTIGTIAAALLGFSGSAQRAEKPKYGVSRPAHFRCSFVTCMAPSLLPDQALVAVHHTLRRTVLLPD